jgi:metallo-beta-lactamase class B
MGGVAVEARPSRKVLMNRVLGAVATAAVLAAATGYGQELATPTPVAPTADRDAMYDHVQKAREAAGLDLYSHFTHRCLFNQAYSLSLARHNEWPAAIEPFKVFDNLYFVGQNAVSAWALTTSEGIVLFDTLNSADEAKTYLVGGLVKLGLKPEDIKYIVLTHGHGDHFNGAAFLQAAYGAKVMASRTDWDAILRPGRSSGAVADSAPSPARLQHGLDIEDGQQFKIGDTTLAFYITPGHTAGTVTTVFQTTDRGAPHVVGFFGGLGTPASTEGKKQIVASFDRFASIAGAAGVDVLIANQTQDRAKENLELLRLRRAGDPNPFVIGKDAYLRYLRVQRECTLYAMARQGQK